MEKLISREFWDAALARAIRTIAQTAVATIGSSAVLGEVDWKIVASASVLAGIVSILTSIAMTPPEVMEGDIIALEYEEQEIGNDEEEDEEKDVEGLEA